MKKLKSTILVTLLSLSTLGSAQAGWFDWLFPPSTYTQTKHPIVMIGGFLAFDDILGIDYFYGIPKELREDGATVYPLNISTFNGSEVRGKQLIDHLVYLQNRYGHKKFNIIGHSGGATTARYVATKRPDLVASVTSVHGGHKGLDFADFVQDVNKDLESGGTLSVATRDFLANAFNAFGYAVEFLSGNSMEDYPQDALAMLEDYSTEKSLAFNQDFPDGVPTTACGEGAYSANGIRYYSWAGTSVFTNALDPVDYFFALSSQFYDGQNDGLVGRCSSHLGQVIRDDYNLNHADAINQVFGLRGLLSPSPASLYRQQANRLKNAGL